MMMDRSQRCAARVFGIIYIPWFAIIFIAFSRFYAPYLVWGNGEQTARHFVGHEPAIRIYLACAFLHGIGTVVLLTALYVILRPVNRGLALFAAFSKLIYTAFWFIVQLELLDALRLIAGSASLRILGSDGLIALAGMRLDSSRDAYYIGLVFAALGSALFAWAFVQSRYIPRTLALWGVLASGYEGICGFAYLFRRDFAAILSPDWYEFPVLTFELLLCAWLLVRGFKSSMQTATNR